MTIDDATAVPVSVRPGDARCPGPSTRDIVLGDSAPAPSPVLEESYDFRGDSDISYDDFTSPDYLQAEFDHMWSRTWQWACREEHIPEPSDYYVHDIGDHSALIVRGPDGTIPVSKNFSTCSWRARTPTIRCRGYPKVNEHEMCTPGTCKT